MSTLSLVRPNNPTVTVPFFTITYGATSGFFVVLSNRFAHVSGSCVRLYCASRKALPYRSSFSLMPTASVPSSFIASIRNHAASW